MLDEGSHQMNDVEKSSIEEQVEDERNLDLVNEKLLRLSQFRFTMMVNSMQTANHVMRSSTQQWSTFLKTSQKWMGNFAIEEQNQDYFAMDQYALKTLKKSILVVQQVRSHYESLVQKDDIWQTKHMFKNEVTRCILESNFETDTQEELIKAVKQ